MRKLLPGEKWAVDCYLGLVPEDMPKYIELKVVSEPTKDRATGTVLVKYSFVVWGVPVYRSDVILEFEEEERNFWNFWKSSQEKKLIFHNSSKNTEHIVGTFPSQIPTLDEDGLEQTIKEHSAKIWLRSQGGDVAKKGENLDLEGIELNPKLYFYWDDEEWRLVYITHTLCIYDHIVDAHNGEVICRLSNFRSVC